MHKFHDNAMPVKINWLWNWKPPIVQSFHIRKFFRCRNSGQVQPTHLLPLLVIVSFFANLSEASPAKTVQLQAKLLSLLVRNNVNVGLLASPYLIAKRFDRIPTCQSFQSQVIVTSVCEPVATVPVPATLILKKSTMNYYKIKIILTVFTFKGLPVPAQFLQKLGSSSANCCNRHHQSFWNKFVILHSHFHSCQDPELISCEVSQ